MRTYRDSAGTLGEREKLITSGRTERTGKEDREQQVSERRPPRAPAHRAPDSRPTGLIAHGWAMF